MYSHIYAYYIYNRLYHNLYLGQEKMVWPQTRHQKACCGPQAQYHADWRRPDRPWPCTNPERGAGGCTDRVCFSFGRTRHRPFLYRTISCQFGRLFCGSVYGFRQRRVHLFPPRLLSKNEASMCRQLCEMGGGVADVHCCATHSRGVLKPGGKQLITAVSPSLHPWISRWTTGQLLRSEGC